MLYNQNSTLPIDPVFYAGPVQLFGGSTIANPGLPAPGITAVYLGKTQKSFTPASLRFYVGSVASSGSMQAFLASTPAEPDSTNKTLTVLDFVTTPSITSGGNTWKSCTGWTVAIPSGVHLWAGFRANYTGSPTMFGGSEVASTGSLGFTQAMYSSVPTMSIGATISAIKDSGLYIAPFLQPT